MTHRMGSNIDHCLFIHDFSSRLNMSFMACNRSLSLPLTSLSPVQFSALTNLTSLWVLWFLPYRDGEFSRFLFVHVVHLCTHGCLDFSPIGWTAWSLCKLKGECHSNNPQGHCNSFVVQTSSPSTWTPLLISCVTFLQLSIRPAFKSLVASNFYGLVHNHSLKGYNHLQCVLYKRSVPSGTVLHGV